ncbi:hypothetical protein B0T17DRAFT_603215 [Bombardia bombarda]|uniref:Uncharacterized protein n=1 Tax=Bombardia bombarda TaxID=252184 RepID=A0AA39U3Z2_9PEZI|nr:hypothetical protein B0T17DRAFT_603215 [Bombardia bombarda]
MISEPAGDKQPQGATTGLVVLWEARWHHSPKMGVTAPCVGGAAAAPCRQTRGGFVQCLLFQIGLPRPPLSHFATSNGFLLCLPARSLCSSQWNCNPNPYWTGLLRTSNGWLFLAGCAAQETGWEVRSAFAVLSLIDQFGRVSSFVLVVWWEARHSQAGGPVFFWWSRAASSLAKPSPPPLLADVPPSLRPQLRIQTDCLCGALHGILPDCAVIVSRPTAVDTEQGCSEINHCNTNSAAGAAQPHHPDQPILPTLPSLPTARCHCSVCLSACLPACLSLAPVGVLCPPRAVCFMLAKLRASLPPPFPRPPTPHDGSLACCHASSSSLPITKSIFCRDAACWDGRSLLDLRALDPREPWEPRDLAGETWCLLGPLAPVNPVPTPCLTSPAVIRSCAFLAGQNQGWPNDSSRFSDDEIEGGTERSPSKTATSDLLSSAFRGIKKITPNRDDFARLTRQQQPAQLAGQRRPSEATIPILPVPPTRSGPSQAQHARSLSLQNSLKKPLPEPPPPQLSPAGPPTPLAYLPQQGSLATILDSEEPAMDGRTSTMDSASSVEMGSGLYMRPQDTSGQDAYMTSSQSSLANASRQGGGEERTDNLTPRSNGPLSAGPSPNVGTARTPGGAGAAVGTPASAASSQHLSGLMCNVHRTTGREPHPLVGATTTILGDSLYVFGGRILSRSRPAPLTADLYELDLIRRHWKKLETSGDIPPPRYFHSMCPLGDTKMVCYGGMSPTPNQKNMTAPQDQPEVTVMTDIYIYDVPSKRWTFIPTQDAPQGRYAHCACILPSSASFASHRAPLSALQHNPSTGNPNEGRIGISIDGTGGAEMVVVGGQDGANHYIEQISVFNLRSLKWTSTQSLGKSCGAYRSVVAPLPPSVTAKIGRPPNSARQDTSGISQEAKEPGSSMLIYSNYNFLDVKLELQIRGSDGNLTERPMSGAHSPPGLRFPNGGVIDTHFVVSGTYLTSSKQEYALWALDLRTLTWSRIDAGGAVFSQGSWNRGVLWNRRNTFVVLGNRKRSLVDDYNHRRINFSNVCMVELEAFGFFDNPRKTAPMSGFVSASSPYTGPGLSLARKAGFTAGGRHHSRAAEELGEKALVMRELADMDILCIGGERIPINSRIVARRWGPYFVQLLREGTATQDGSDSITLRSNSISAPGSTARSSNMGINTGSQMSMNSGQFSSNSSGGKPPSTSGSSVSGGVMSPPVDPAAINTAPTPRTLPPNSRPRCLYLPHTYLTIQALLHYLYTSSLPPPSSPLCTPQILCSLLQIARPYRVDGLLEAVVERLHSLLESRNAAAVFNATAMAAGGGRGIDGTLNPNFFPLTAGIDGMYSPTDAQSNGGSLGGEPGASGANGSLGRAAGLRITTALPQGARPSSEELSATTSVSGSEWSSEVGDSERGGAREVWSGELSSVIGLQKRGLRGLMEGRRMRDRTGTNPGGGGGMGMAGPNGGPSGGGAYGGPMQGRVGLGIAGS